MFCTPLLFFFFQKKKFQKIFFRENKKMGSAHFYYLSNDVSLIKIVLSINSFRTHERTEGQTRAFETTLRQHKLTPFSPLASLASRVTRDAPGLAPAAGKKMGVLSF